MPYCSHKIKLLVLQPRKNLPYKILYHLSVLTKYTLLPFCSCKIKLPKCSITSLITVPVVKKTVQFLSLLCTHKIQLIALLQSQNKIAGLITSQKPTVLILLSQPPIFPDITHQKRTIFTLSTHLFSP
jgi:hypothetical protein